MYCSGQRLVVPASNLAARAQKRLEPGYHGGVGLAGLAHGGRFFIEYIFNWKGLGSVTLHAIENLDFPVVMGATLCIAFLFILINIFVDVRYTVVDPRVKL